METAVFSTYLLAISTLFLVGIASGCRDHGLPAKPAALFIFGDSIFDTGNNYFKTRRALQANYRPYGETFFPFSTGRAIDGCTIPDVFYLKTWLSNGKKVEKQLKEKLGGEKAKTLLSTAVYLFSAGGNDYFDHFLKNSSFFESLYVRKQHTDVVIGNLTNVIQEIYKLGGRKFEFLNLTPIGCLPFVKATAKSDGCVKDLTEVAKQHNKTLSEALQKLESHLTGFKEVNMACCGSGPYRGLSTCGRKEYKLCKNSRHFLYFDSFHPTEKAYKQIAKLFWSGSCDITWPYNL